MHNGFYNIYCSLNSKEKISKYLEILDNIEYSFCNPSCPDDDLIVSVASFLYGFCGELAFFFNRRYGYKIEVLYSMNNGKFEIAHVYNTFKKDGTKYYIDCRGITDSFDIFSEIFECDLLCADDEDFIKEMNLHSLFPEDDISEKMIEWLIHSFGNYYIV